MKDYSRSKTRQFPDAKPMLHDVKKQIATSAHAVEVLGTDERPPTRTVRFPYDFLTTLSNIAQHGAVAALRRERTCLRDNVPRGLAVEADAHRAFGPQQRKQHAPSGFRIRRGGAVLRRPRSDRRCGQASPNSECRPAHIRCAQTELAGFPSRVSEAWQTEVNRKHARIGKNLRHKHRVLSGTAAGD